MGREVRRVPPWWVHPKKEVVGLRGQVEPRYAPMHDEDFATAYAAWQVELQEWLDDKGGSRTEAITSLREDTTDADTRETLRLVEAGQLVNAFVLYHSHPPDPDYCRPWWAAEDATAYQVYETVSEGTPASPVLATREALVAWLCADHDDWPGIIGWENPGMGRDDFTRHGTWRAFTREMAERFIGDESIPTFVTISGEVMTSLDERVRHVD